MHRRFDFKATLFDVDGTLINSNGAHARAWDQALREHGFDVGLTTIRSLIGMGSDKLLPAVASVTEHSTIGKELSERKKQIFESELPHLLPTQGARELLSSLHETGVKLVIATSADERDVHALLERAGVSDLIPERVSKDDAPHSKPDPDIIQAALSESGVRAGDAVMVGDTPYDIEAATRAGVAAIALRCGGYWSDRELAGAIEIFDDPAALLARWRGSPP